MPRIIFLALLLAVPLAAAPVPTAMKKPKAPPLVGTKWVGVHTDKGLGTVEYEFREDGVLASTKRGNETTTTNTWAADGDTLTWSVNNGYANYTFTLKDGKYEGTALNVKGVTWKVTLTPAEKK